MMTAELEEVLLSASFLTIKPPLSSADFVEMVTLTAAKVFTNGQK